MAHHPFLRWLVTRPDECCYPDLGSAAEAVSEYKRATAAAVPGDGDAWHPDIEEMAIWLCVPLRGLVLRMIGDACDGVAEGIDTPTSPEGLREAAAWLLTLAERHEEREERQRLRRAGHGSGPIAADEDLLPWLDALWALRGGER